MHRQQLRVCQLEDRQTPSVGGLDLTFNLTGTRTLAFDLGSTNEDVATAVAVQPDGRIVAVGFAAQSTADDTDFVVARFNTDGSLDASFGTNGTALISFDAGGSNRDFARDVAITADGKIVIVGTVDLGPNDTDFGIARLLSDGSLDTSFDTDGRQTIGFDLGGGNDFDSAESVTLMPDGRIVVAGTVQRATVGDTDIGLIRLLNNGSLDGTFNTNGRVTFGVDEVGSTLADSAAAVAIDSQGQILVAGTTARATPDDTDFVAVRFDITDGSLDTSYAGGVGFQVISFDQGGNNTDTAEALALDANGSVVIAGTASVSVDDTDFAVVRLLANGTPDPGFGSGGLTVVSFDQGGNFQDSAQSVVVQPDGRVVLAGFAEQTTAGDFDFAIARLNDNGTLDTSFNKTGQLTLAFDTGGDNQDAAFAIARMADGRLVVVGSARAGAGTDSDFALARIQGNIGLPAGTLASGPINSKASLFSPDEIAQLVLGNSFSPFPTSAGNSRSAVADVDGDGIDDFIFAISPGGGSLVRIIDGATGQDLVPLTATFESGFSGGLYVAAGDLDGDGRAEVVVSPDQGGGGRVQVFSAMGGILTQQANFFGIDDDAFRGGARVAVGDIDGDGVRDLLVVAGFGGGPRVALFDGLTLTTQPIKLVDDFFAFEPALRDGAFASIGDVTGDGRGDLAFGGGPGGAPRVLVLDAALILVDDGAVAAQAGPLANFFVAGDITTRGGVRLTTRDLDGDERADLVVGSGEGNPSEVRTYRGRNFPAVDEPALLQSLDPFGAILDDGVFVG